MRRIDVSRQLSSRMDVSAGMGVSTPSINQRAEALIQYPVLFGASLTPERVSSNWSSDEAWTDDVHRGPEKHRERRYRSPFSPDSGSSIFTPEADKRTRRGRRGTSSPARIFTRRENREIRRSLRRKLLSNNGALLSRIERHLLRDDHRGNGLVPAAALKDALAMRSESEDGGGRILQEEVLWLLEKLKTRSGKRVAIFKIRPLLELRSKEERGETNGGSRRGRDDMEGPAEIEPPPRWVTRQGTVGQWLHDVASPMERKLFFEFVKDLEKFELSNGLDHYRLRSGDRTGEPGTVRDGGTTILHLGPMLKASLKFYV